MRGRIPILTDPLQYALVSPKHDYFARKHFWHLDDYGQVVRSLPNQGAYDFLQVSRKRNPKLIYLDQQIMSDLLGRPVIEVVYHRNKNLLDCRVNNLYIRPLPGVEIRLPDEGTMGCISEIDYKRLPFIPGSDQIIGSDFLRSTVLNQIFPYADDYKCINGDKRNVQRSNLIPLYKSPFFDYFSENYREPLIGCYYVNRSTVNDYLGYWIDLSEIDFADGNPRNLHLKNLKIKVDDHSVTNRLRHRWMTNTLIQKAHDMYRICHSLCNYKCNFTNCLGKNFLKNIERLFHQTRFEFSSSQNIAVKCHTECCGNCWQWSDSGCYGKSENYKVTSERLFQLEGIKNQIVTFLAVNELVSLTMEYLSENSFIELTYENMKSSLFSDTEYRLTPLEYKQLKSSSLRLFYDLCILSQYDTQHIEWYRAHPQEKIRVSELPKSEVLSIRKLLVEWENILFYLDSMKKNARKIVMENIAEVCILDTTVY